MIGARAAMAAVGLGALAAGAFLAVSQRTQPAIPHFDIGRPATAYEIAALDIDVMPDGTGLPPGEGSVVQGEAVYQAKCVACHGIRGQGGAQMPLVGRVPEDRFPFANHLGTKPTIGNYWPYATTLYDYLRRAMPSDKPGTLRSDEIYALVAVLLYWNEIIPEDTVMNARTLPTVAMPAASRFVPDDRADSSAVR